jgi:hypothetical protein
MERANLALAFALGGASKVILAAQEASGGAFRDGDGFALAQYSGPRIEEWVATKLARAISGRKNVRCGGEECAF